MKGLVHFCYLKTIDASSTSTWDKYVFEDTYKEFFMQAQQFDLQKKYLTFQEIVSNIPKSENMHYLVSTAAIGYLRQLEGKIPGVVNSLGKSFLEFENFKFEIIQSHIQDKNQHRVAIYFYSKPITWIDTIDRHLFLAIGDQREAIASGQKVETDTFIMPPNLSICSYQNEEESVLQSVDGLAR